MQTRPAQAAGSAPSSLNTRALMGARKTTRSGMAPVSSCTGGRIHARPTGLSRTRVLFRSASGDPKVASLPASCAHHGAAGRGLCPCDPRAMEVSVEGRRLARTSAGDRRDGRGDPATADRFRPNRGGRCFRSCCGVSARRWSPWALSRKRSPASARPAPARRSNG